MEHRNHYILTFAFAFDREEDIYYFAFGFPYSYTRCQAHLDLVEKKNFPYLRRETIGYSLQNRNVDVITISNPALLTAKKSKLIVILSRCHPGETPSSYVAQGIMDFMISNHPIAATLREFVVIKIVPMINPDGVFVGNFRCNGMGYDLNRQWDDISPWTHTTLAALQSYFVELDNSKTFELEMVIDLHAHTSLLGLFIQGNSYDDVYRHLWEILKNTVNVYTLEVSCFGYNHPETNAIIPYDEDGYFRAGRNIVRTFLEYYRLVGFIPANVQLPPLPKPTQNQPTEKKGTTKNKLNDRSWSREKEERASSPTQATVISNEENIKPKPSSNPKLENPLNEEITADQAVVKLYQLTKEHDSDFGHSTSSDEDNNDDGDRDRRVKFTGRKRRLQRSKMATAAKGPAPDSSTSPSRKTGSSKPQPQATKTKIPVKTFDFSSLLKTSKAPSKEVGSKSNQPESNRRRMSSSIGQSTARKIGGGVIVGLSRKQPRDISKTLSINLSDTDMEAPCLTIIDFNSLLRKDVDGRTRVNERGWKGCAPGKAGTYKIQNDRAFEGFDSRLIRRRHFQRRRDALFRGNVTDCSPWEDSSSDSDSPIFPITRKIDSFTREGLIRCKSSKAAFSS